MNHPTTPLPDDWLTAYLDGELSDTERAQVEAWLAVDSAARARLEAMRALGEDLRAVPRETLRAETSAKLMEALAREPKPTPHGESSLASPRGPRLRDNSTQRRWLYVLATLATAAMVALFVSPPAQQSPQVSQAPTAREKDRAASLRADQPPIAEAADAQPDEAIAPASPSAMRVAGGASPAMDMPAAQAGPPVPPAVPEAMPEAASAPAPADGAPPLRSAPRLEASEAGREAAGAVSGGLAQRPREPENRDAKQAATVYVDVQVPAEQLESLLGELARSFAELKVAHAPREKADAAAGEVALGEDKANEHGLYIVDEEGGHWMVLAIEPAALLERLNAWPSVSTTTRDLAAEADAVRDRVGEALRYATPDASPRTLLRVR